MEQILKGLLTKTLNVSEDELKSLIYQEDSDKLREDALQVLLDKDAERISQMKDKFQTEKENQYKRAQREISEKWENDIRSRFNLSTDATGEELLSEAVESVQNSDGNDSGKELTDEAVKSHPLYMQLQREKQKEIDSVRSELEQEIEKTKDEYSNKMTTQNVHRKAIDLVRSKNPILPEDATKAQKRLRTILPELSKYGFKQDGDEIIVLNDNGEQLTDQHNNVVKFEDLVDQVSEDYFDFSETDDKGGKGGKSTGNGGKDFGKQKFDRVKVPTNPDELKEALSNAKTADERAAISEAYLATDKDE